jgi:hypothetical protein
MGYVNGLNAQITIGDVVLPAITLEYSDSAQKVPIYGYKSINPDAYLQGETLIQGQFSLALTENQDFERIIAEAPVPFTVSQNATGEGVPAISGSVPIDRTLLEMIVTYGNGFLINLIDVQITGSQMVIGADGSPVAEMYSFIAKRID